MRKHWQEMKSKWGPLVLGACIVVLFYVALSNIGIVWEALKTIVRVLTPIIVGVGVAYILNPFVKFNDRTVFKWIKNRKVSWCLSVALAIILMLVLLALLLYSIIPQIIDSIMNFVGNVNGYLVSLKEWVNNLNIPSDDIVNRLQELINSEGSILSRGLELLVGNLGEIGKRASSIGSGSMNAVIGLILAIYFLVDKEKMLDWIHKFMQLMFSEAHYTNFIEVGNRFNTIFAKYIGCELIDALIVGIVNYIFMLITGMPYAILVSVAVGTANLVPTFGPVVGAVIGGLILLLASPATALWFLIFTFVLQTIDGYWLKPRLFGDALNVPGVLIIIAIIIIGRMFGIVGIFLSIPIAAILVYIVNNFAIPRLAARKKRLDAEKKKAAEKAAEK